MKNRLLLAVVLLLLALPVVSQAQLDHQIIRWERTISTDSACVLNDTVAAHVFYDSVYSDPIRLAFTGSFFPKRTWDNIQFYWRLGPDDVAKYKDSNWVGDTFFVFIQTGIQIGDTSFRWQTPVALDTAVAKDSGWSVANLKPASTVMGDMARFLLVHKDSLEAAIPTAKRGKSYGQRLDIWIKASQ